MNEASQNYIRNTRLTDIGEFKRIARAVNMDITQLDAGAFDGELAQLKVRNVLASLTTSNRRLRLQGNVHFLTLSFAIQASGSAKWRGISVGPSDVLAVNPDEIFDVVIPPGASAYCISLVGNAEVTLRNLGGPALARRLSHTAHPIACDPDAVRKMESWLVKRFDRFGDPSDIGYGAAVELEHEFLRRLAACMRAETRSSGNGDTTVAARMDVVRRVEQHLLDDLALPQTVDELCHVGRTSRRTLEYAFREYFGTSPKRFIKALRLNAARNDLLRGEYGSAQVVEIASGWGFNHMGQFSSDYRHMFGEKPSKTLRRRA